MQKKLSIFLKMNQDFFIQHSIAVEMWKQGSRGVYSQQAQGVISVRFGSQISWRLLYCKTDEVYITKLLWQNMDGKMASYRECCFPNCTKLWWIQLLSWF